MNTSVQNRTLKVLALVGGIAVLASAILFSSPTIENALVSDPARSLSWGPSLFRVLLAFHGIALVVAAGFSSKRATVTQSNAVEPRMSRNSLLVLIALSAVGLALRLVHLNADLWFDELLTL